MCVNLFYVASAVLYIVFLYGCLLMGRESRTWGVGDAFMQAAMLLFIVWFFVALVFVMWFQLTMSKQ